MALSIFAAATDAPDRPALVADGRAIDHAELADRARHAVAWLRQRGLDGSPLLALDGDSKTTTLVMVHALIALGTPLLLLHPRWGRDERRVGLDEAGSPPLVEPAWERGGEASVADATGAADHAWTDPQPPPDDDRPLAVLHTSGSAGRPRAVVLSRRAFVASAVASSANLGWRDDDRWLLRLPVAHVGGLSVVTRCLLARATVVLAPDAGHRTAMEVMERERVTLVSLVPTLLARLLDLDAHAPPPSHLRAVLLGGAAVSPDLLGRAADRGWPVLTTYGLTEACSQVTTQDYGTVNRSELGSGRPLPGTEVRVDDSGQILVRGPTLMNGYLGPAGLVRPFRDDGWLETGDHGRIDTAGNLHVLGRRGDRIVTGGENVDPVEVEQALERVTGVRQACVFGIPDPEWGELVCAAVVAERDLDLDNLVHELERDLASFKRPRRIATLDALPVGGPGKVDRQAAARLATPRLRPL